MLNLKQSNQFKLEMQLLTEMLSFFKNICLNLFEIDAAKVQF